MSRLIDITGQTFYEWTVLEKAKPSEHGRTMWKCRCSCGKEGNVSGYDLRNGKHKSCGHDRKTSHTDLEGKVFGEITALEYIGKSLWKCEDIHGEIFEVHSQKLRDGSVQKKEDLTIKVRGKRDWIDLKGKKIHKWEVIEYKKKSMWLCECECGTKREVHSYALRNNQTKSCGLCGTSSRLEDLTGRTFNDWEALEYSKELAKWKCRCSCGNEGYVTPYDLKNGNSRNCGHNRKKPYKDLTGMTFGEYTVGKYIAKGRYMANCSCGEVKEVIGSNLTSGSTISCGHYGKTIYTQEFMEILIDEYEEQHSEKACIHDLVDKLPEITPTYVRQLVNKYDLDSRLDPIFGSRYEREIYNEIRKVYDGEIDINKYNVLNDGKQLDLYLPEFKLAIEFNGDYWHNDTMIDKKYHQNKTIQSAKQGIRLIHIYEYEWRIEELRDKIIKMIHGIITKNKVIYARKCSIKEVERDEEKKFLEEYHLQGHSDSRVAYGVYQQDELVSIMTFSRPRFNRNYKWEILRYVTKNELTIVGGAERLFKRFLGDKNPANVITYSDIGKFTGNIYTRLGFKAGADDITEPNYRWVKPMRYGETEVEVLSRYQTQKQRLLDEGYGVYGDTEDEIMKNIGYYKIYDSGNLRLVWDKKKQ